MQADNRILIDALTELAAWIHNPDPTFYREMGDASEIAITALRNYERARKRPSPDCPNPMG